MKSQKGFTLVEGLLTVLILSVIGFAGYTVWNSNQDDESPGTAIIQENTSVNEPGEAPATEETAIQEALPEGWKAHEDKDSLLTFNYPSSWDTWGKDYPEWTSLYKDNGFRITRTAVGESFLAPMGGGGGGLRHIYDAMGNRWLNLESFQSTASEGALSEHLTQIKINNTDYTTAYGAMGEGGAITQYFLVTDGEYAYQVVFPFISEEFDKDSSGKYQEQKDSIVEVIESVSFSG